MNKEQRRNNFERIKDAFGLKEELNPLTPEERKPTKGEILEDELNGEESNSKELQTSI